MKVNYVKAGVAGLIVSAGCLANVASAGVILINDYGHATGNVVAQHFAAHGTATRAYSQDSSDSFALDRFDASLGDLTGATLVWSASTYIRTYSYVWDRHPAYTAPSPTNKVVRAAHGATSSATFDGSALFDYDFSNTTGCTSAVSQRGGGWYDKCSPGTVRNSQRFGNSIDLFNLYTVPELTQTSLAEVFNVNLSGFQRLDATCNVRNVPDDYCGAVTYQHLFVKASIQYTYTERSAVGVPEPAMLALFGLGIAGAGFARRNKS